MPHLVARRSGSLWDVRLHQRRQGHGWAADESPVASTLIPLSEDMARAAGASAAGLHVTGYPAEQHPAFFAMTQQQYQVLVHAGETSSVAVVKALQDAVSGRARSPRFPIDRDCLLISPCFRVECHSPGTRD